MACFQQLILPKEFADIGRLRSLHWVKDMVFDEDRLTIRMGSIPANLSIVRVLAKLLRSPLGKALLAE
ncbi:hypothetical protein CEN49_20145 [Fischerella thermalis CCMEE 5273]|nr:hypothetical protein CEN49_20145 [Fischerella thermalis CCMEE 5273]PMB49126.1 hypothetical protein CEN40_05710 [Fischerella thermalis CCMEE 5205]